MSTRIRAAVLICVVAATGAGAAGCGKTPGDRSQTATSERADAAESIELKCGTTTYRILRRRVTSDVHAACDRVDVSLAALQTYRASVARFTCQESDGRVVHSLLVPKDLRGAYEQNCQAYLRASDAFRAARVAPSAERNAAVRSHREAFKRFEDGADTLARTYSTEDGALFRQRQADQGSMNALVKDLRGAIEIAN